MTEQEQKSDRDDLAFEIEVVETHDNYVILRMFFRSDNNLNYSDDVRMVKGQKWQVWDNQPSNKSMVGYVSLPRETFKDLDIGKDNTLIQEQKRKELKDE